MESLFSKVPDARRLVSISHSLRCLTQRNCACIKSEWAGSASGEKPARPSAWMRQRSLVHLCAQRFQMSGTRMIFTTIEKANSAAYAEEIRSSATLDSAAYSTAG